MEWIELLWQNISPYLMELMQWLVNTGVGSAIALLVVKKWEKKHSDNNLASNIAYNVANNIVNKDILVSLESVNKTQLETIKTQLLKEFKGAFEFIGLQNDVLTAMSKIMIKFKSASESERQELINAINKIEKKENKQLTIEEKEQPVIITIEPVEETKINNESLF